MSIPIVGLNTSERFSPGGVGWTPLVHWRLSKYRPRRARGRNLRSSAMTLFAIALPRFKLNLAGDKTDTSGERLRDCDWKGSRPRDCAASLN